MSTTFIHTRIGVIDANGDTSVLYPQTTAADVSVSRSNNAAIPSDVTTIQGLADKLAATAFATPIDDTVTTASNTWSATKINGALAELNSKDTDLQDSIYACREPRRILTDNNGTITPGIVNSYAELHTLINSGNYDKYLKDEDFIDLTCADGKTYTLQANIDTYYKYSDNEIPHHIDFIAKELIYGSYGTKMRTTKTNNGTEAVQNPYLASNETGCVLKFLETYLTKIPSGLKSYIVEKRMLIPTRYSSSSTTLTDDNNWTWGSLPKLWIPFEGEVSKSIVWSTKGFGNGGCHHYPIFSKGKNIVKLITGESSRRYWWLASAYSGNATHFCFVGDHGGFSDYSASGTSIAVPLCLRFV